MDTLTQALEYHRRGWSIIPIQPGTKVAAGSWKGYQERQAAEAQLRVWFGNGQAYGLAVLFGEASGGLVCRDFDTMAGYERWARQHPELAATLPTVATARGRHVYFRGTERRIAKLADGELRGAGYCLLPPSRHPDGPVYSWLVLLPDGPVPFISDVYAAGLGPKGIPQQAAGVRRVRGQAVKTTDVVEFFRALAERPEAGLDDVVCGGMIECLGGAQ
jgi:hypothetical protein